jgi:uncharacterized membrane-anchored protein
MAFYDNVLNFITDRTNRMSARATVIIVALVCILLVDNILGFSFYYNKQRQLEQLKSITQLLKDTSITADTRSNLIELEHQTFARRTIVDHFSSFLKKISWTSSRQSQNTINNNANPTRNDFWFLFSASGFYIIITILVVPVLLFTDKKTPFLKLIATLLIFIFVMLFTSWFNYWLFDKLIPDRLFGSWTWNYVANFLLQIGLGLGLYFANKYRVPK